MPTPDFILDLRAKVGSMPLWLSGATAVVLREGADGPEVLCVQRADNGSWTAICGVVDPGEDPHVTCVREAAEEAGVEIEVERLVLMAVTGTVTYPNADQTNYLDHTFRARWVSGEAHVADDESASVGWFPAHQLPEPMSEQMRTRIAVALHNPADVVLGAEAAQRLTATRA